MKRHQDFVPGGCEREDLPLGELHSELVYVGMDILVGNEFRSRFRLVRKMYVSPRIIKGTRLDDGVGNAEYHQQRKWAIFSHMNCDGLDQSPISHGTIRGEHESRIRVRKADGPLRLMF